MLIKEIQDKNKYGTHDIIKFLPKLLGTSTRILNVYPLPTEMKKNPTRAHVISAQFIHEKSASSFGDCHTYPLSSIRVMISNKDKRNRINGYIVSQNLSYLGKANNINVENFSTFQTFLVERFKASGFFQSNEERKSYISNFTSLAKEISGKTYYMSAVPAVDFETSQIYTSKKDSDDFKLLKATTRIPCGS